MNLTEELGAILVRPTRAKTVVQDFTYFQLTVFPIIEEMAKRIEELEQREHSHPLGVGSLAKRRQGE